MKRKTLALLLSGILALPLSPLARASEVRETDFFEPQPHTELKFDELEYKHIDPEPLLAAMKTIRTLSADGANEAKVAEQFQTLATQMMELLTMYSLAEVKFSLNAADEALSQESQYAASSGTTATDAFSALCRDILRSPCAGFLREQLSEDDLEFYSEYEDMTEEQKAMADQEKALENAYESAALKSFSVEYEGQSYTQASLAAAASLGLLDFDTYCQLLSDIYRQQNEVLGGYYLELVELRRKIAQGEGYDSYSEYAYEEIYRRDYTPEEIKPFHQAVKECMTHAGEVFSDLSAYESNDPVFYKDYTGDVSLDMTEEYFGRMSSELAESFTYMREHNLCSLTDSEVKQAGGYTTMFYSFGAPFMYNKPTNTLYDFTTLVHEFGHYNHFYWTPADWNDSSTVIDLSEVHSQGMELLFSHYYPEIFGDSAAVATDYLMGNLTGAILQGAMVDELEQFVYSKDNLTLEDVNKTFAQLNQVYGIVEEGSPLETLYSYSWTGISHLFSAPCYYISYATSAAGAFTFWLSAQEGGFMDAVDEYLAFAALPAELGFQESFEAMGLEDPMRDEALERLSQELLERLDGENRLTAATLASLFQDLDGIQWYNDAVLAMASDGLVTGYEDRSFRPNANVTWGQALKMLLLFSGAEPQAPVDSHWASGYALLAETLGILEEGEPLDSEITRQEMAALLCAMLDIAPSKAASPFSDTSDGYVTALAEQGILTGFTGEEETLVFDGGAPLTRAQLCQILYNALDVLETELETEPEADIAA